MEGTEESWRKLQEAEIRLVVGDDDVPVSVSVVIHTLERLLAGDGGEDGFREAARTDQNSPERFRPLHAAMFARDQPGLAGLVILSRTNGYYLML